MCGCASKSSDQMHVKYVRLLGGSKLVKYFVWVVSCCSGQWMRGWVVSAMGYQRSVRLWCDWPALLQITALSKIAPGLFSAQSLSPTCLLTTVPLMSPSNATKSAENPLTRTFSGECNFYGTLKGIQFSIRGPFSQNLNGPGNKMPLCANRGSASPTASKKQNYYYNF